MKRFCGIVYLFFCLASAFDLKAQQDPIYSQYMFNTLLINPAYAGNRDVLNVTSLYRQQWLNISEAPKTFAFAIDAPIKNEKFGVGLISNFDYVGYTSITSTFAQLSYRVRMSKKGVFSFGTSIGAQQFKFDMSNIIYKIPGQTSPDATFDNNLIKRVPNIGIGLYYHTDRAYLGLSVPHVLNNSLSSGDFQLNFNKISQNARQFRHYMLMAGFVGHISNSWVIKPSTLVKAVSGAPIQIDANVNFWYYDFLGFGLSYRSSNGIVGMLELQIKPEFRIGYAYDYSTNGLNAYNAGAHEIMLRYEFGSRKSNMLSPRYF